MINFSITNIDSGWTEVKLDNGDEYIDLFATYLSDGIKKLIIAIRLLLENNSSSVCRWEDEPGQFRWLFSTENETLSLRIIRFEDTFSNFNDNAGKIIFEAKEDLYKFTRIVISELQKYLDDHGKEFYEKQWHYEFPSKELERLRYSINKNSKYIN